MTRILTLLCVLTLGASLAFAQLSGEIHIGSGGSYATLSDAFAAINSSGVSGTLTLLIDEDITEPSTTTNLNSPTLTGSNKLVIKPNTSANPIITVQSEPIEINQASQVTIDGSNDGSSSQNMIIRHMTGGSGTSVIRIRANSDTVTVKNCIIGSATSVPDFAIRVDPSSSTVDALTIMNNELHGMGATNGIVYLYKVGANTNVTQNVVYGDSAGTKAYGINLSNTSGSPAISISGNQINVIKCGSGDMVGIREEYDADASLLIANNMVGGTFTSSSAANYYLLLGFYGSGAKQVYFNTLYLNSIGSTPFAAACVYMDFGTVDFKNNIAIIPWNYSAAYCIYMDFNFTPADLTSDYNDLYDQGAGSKIAYVTTDYDPLSTWKLYATSPDQNSHSFAVNFENTASNLHIGALSLGDPQLLGDDTYNSAVSSLDIDGDTRHTGVDGPYIGADEGSVLLPVQLVSLNATSERLDAVLTWSTATETNNYGFDIERRQVSNLQSSVSNLQWTKVGFVPGSGTSTSPHEYSYRDAGLEPGRYAYRIKQIDNDGTFAYYAAAEIEVGAAPKVLALNPNFPNPFNPVTNIEFTVPDNGRVRLKVFNVIGQEVATLFDAEAEAGRIYQATFNAASLPSGVYVSRLEFRGKSLLRKMVLMK